MQTVKIKTAELAGKLKANRTVHEREYKAAMVGFRAAVITECERMLAEAREHQDVAWMMPGKPREYLRDYDRAIAMADASVDEVVTLTATDFARYWLDDWEWSESFKTSTASYAAGSTRR